MVLMLKPVEKRSLATEVFEQLRDHIVGGALAAGDALPSERVLAEQLGVNRGAVREGLKRLEQAGLVAIQQGGATRVRDFERSAGLEVLAAMVVRRDGTIDTKIARGILELRSELAPVIARLACAHVTDETADGLRAATAELVARREDVAALQRGALAFWGAMVDATDNLALSLAFHSLQRTYGGVLDQLTQVLAAEVGAVDEYAALADAVVARDAPAAEALASGIVARGAAAIEQVLAALDAVQGR